MIKTLLFLTALGLSQAATARDHVRVVDASEEVTPEPTAPHPDCPEYDHLLLPHETDKTKFYYCANGNIFLNPRQCPQGLEFLASAQVCVWPQVNGKTLKINAGVPVLPNLVGVPANQDLDSCEWFENGCPSDFDRYVVIAHETSCRKYWQCVNGERAERRCARGTVFNPATLVCDHPWNVDRTCEVEESSEEIIDETEEIQGSFEVLPNGCPVDGTIGLLLPHAYCNMFYQCVWGSQVVQYCPPGTHFNPANQQCIHASESTCTRGEGTSTTSTTQAPSQPTPPSATLPNGCPIDGSITWNVAHPDCSKFYACVWGQLIEMSCPAGLHFSVAAQACLSPGVAGCKVCDSNCPGTSSEEDDNLGGDDPGPSTSGPTTVTATPTTTTAAPTTTTAAPTTTTAAPTTTTAAPTTTTAAPTTTTAAPTTTTAAPTTTTAAPTTTTAAPTTTTAAPTTTTAAPTTTTSAPTTTTAAPTTTTAAPPSTTTSRPIDPDCEEHDSNKICEEECNVFPWAHSDCDKFWTCDGKNAVLVVCTEGLFFNPSTGTCDFPCNTECVRSTVQATASHSGLKVYLPWHKIDEDTKSLLKLISN